MQRYKFVEGVDEAWMEYDDHLPRDDQRAHVAEQSPLYLCSEADKRFAAFADEVEILNDICDRKQDRLDKMEIELASKDSRIAELERYKVAVDEHNKDCDDRCGDAASCGYRQYFVNNGRRCPNCPVHEKIDL